MLALTAIVGVILLQASAQNVGTTTDTYSVANLSLGTASNTTAVYFTDIRALSSVVVVNNTNGAVLPSSNYTVTNNVVYNGALAVKVEQSIPPTTGFTGYILNISGTAQPTTYIDDGGARSVASLIIILMALTLAVVIISYGIREYY